MDTARSTALKILIEYDKKGVFPNLSLKNHLREIENERDRKFISALVYGVIEKRRILDYYIDVVSSVKIKKINVAVINILRMGLYQLIFLSTPTSAACNTSVELAKKTGQYKSAGFVNAILRKLSTEYSNICPPQNDAVKFSVGDSVFNKLSCSLGYDGAISFLNTHLDDKRIFIAVNTCKVSCDDLIKLLDVEGTTASKTDYSNLLSVELGTPIENSSAYKMGLFHVLGLPSYLAVRALSPCENDNIIDMCAAPGGKTFTIAYFCSDNTEIKAFDVHEHKIKNLKNDCIRLSLKSVKPVLHDSCVFNSKYVGSADKILCDVPCSGLGMLFKKPDIRYNDIDYDSIIDVQYKILSNAGMYLKSGGRLVYSTCTVNSDENIGIVERFVRDNHDFIIDNSVDIYNGNFGEYTFLPQNDKTDGFYICVLVKK